MRLNRVRRPWRVVLSLLITLELVALLWLVLAQIFGVGVFEPGDDAGTALLIAVVLGFAVYGLGWAALVGFDLDPDRPWRAGRLAVLYVAAGAAGAFTVAVLILYGLIFGYVL